ncbi:MAG TPA: mechanosensitive ion channel [bacterium]|nr:mechanosensitive ion channel [bacterium]
MDGYLSLVQFFFARYSFLVFPARMLAVAIIAYLLFFIGRHYILKAVGYMVRRSTADWDDLLFEKRVFHALIHLIPILVVHNAAYAFGGLETAVRRLTSAAIVLVVALFFSRLVAVLQALYDRTDAAQERPIKGLFQILSIAVYIVALILMAAVLMGKSPVLILSGLGAMTAVLMLVFKDAILGFVASLQMSVNNSIRVGDWISVPQYGADGEVADVSLYALRVRNWDNTITSIPTQKFLEEAFTNWRGMKESGARRVSRSIPIDLNSVRFLDAVEVAAIRADEKVAPFLPDLPATGPVTNLTLLRRMFMNYLRSRAVLRQDLTLMVRTLDPSHTGAPLQIYCFAATTVWEDYEAIQGELLEYLTALTPIFGLRIIQIRSDGRTPSN